jgi:hypothetical protein
MRVEREGQWLPLEYQVRFTFHHLLLYRVKPPPGTKRVPNSLMKGGFLVVAYG